MGAGGVGRPSPGPGPSPSSSPGPGSKPLPWKSTYVEDPISRVPHTNPSQNSIPLASSPSGARIATRPGSTIAMRTPANRSQNLDRRLSGQANTTQLSAPLRMASNESTNTTFMPQSYHPRRRRREHAWRDSLCEDSTLWTDRCLGFERQRARSLPRSGDLPCRHRNATIRSRGVITIDVSADDWIAQQEVSAPTGAPRLPRHDGGPSSLVGTDRAPRSVHVGVLALRHERR